MKPHMPCARALSLLLVLLAAGCLGAPLNEAGEAALDDPAPRPEWLRCWVVPEADAAADPAFAQDHLFCQWTKPAETAAIRIAHVFVQAAAGSRVAETQMLERWPGQPYEVMAISPSEYPVRVSLQLLMDAGRPVGLETLGELRTTTTLANAAAATAETPWIVGQPFDTWTVTIDVQTLILEATLFRTDVPLAPWTSPLLGDVAQAAGRTPLGRRGQLMTLVFAVPTGTTTLSGDARLGREETRVPFTLDGPGAYVATPTGITRVPPPEVPPAEGTPSDESGGLPAPAP